MIAVKEVEVKRKHNFNIIKSIIITPLSNIKLNGKYITPLPQSFLLMWQLPNLLDLKHL